MDCLDIEQIRSYVQGAMSSPEADWVKNHLVSCKRCRQVVAEMRESPPAAGYSAPTEQFARQGTLIKVQCEQCQMRYGIPLERVEGRVLRIRCRSCGNTIEVRNPDSVGAVTPAVSRSQKSWFIVIRGERVGPLAEDEVRRRLEQGELKGKTYVWCHGFAKWERMRDLPEFRDLVEQLEQLGGGRAQLSGATPSPVTGAELRGPFDPEEASTETAMHRDQRLGEDSAAEGQLTHIHFKQQAELPDVGQDMGDGLAASNLAEQPASLGPPSPRMRAGDWDQYMKGQRREESVLFSLTHLKKIAAAQRPTTAARPSPGDHSTSGLFDIRPLGGPPAQALLLPQQFSEEKRTGIGLVVGIALASVILGAGALLGILYLAQPKLVSALFGGEQLVVVREGNGTGSGAGPAARSGGAARAPDAQAQAGRPLQGDGRAASPRAEAQASDRGPGKPAAPRAGAGGAAVAARRTKAKGQKRGASEEAIAQGELEPEALENVARPAPASAEPARKPSPARESRRGGGERSELDQLIDDAADVVSGKAKKTAPVQKNAEAASDAPAASAPPPSEQQLPVRPSRDQVAAAMRRAEAGTRLCYARYRERGTVTVEVSISGSTGRIEAGRVLGEWGGTPTGNCVLTTVKTMAVFPRFSSPQLTVQYPYLLR